MNDLKFALRQLFKNRTYAAIAVVTLALGIGMNTSMFSALRTLLDRTLPYPDPERVVQLFQVNSSSPRLAHHSVADFLDYRESGAFDSMAAITDRPFSLVESGQAAERVQGLLVSADFFPLLDVAPELGRFFAKEEDRPGQNNVVILDHGFWQRRFAGDPNIVGRVLRLDGEPVTVVGVMPARFHDLMLAGPVNLWRPIAFTSADGQQRGHQYLKIIARVNSGMSARQAQAAADRMIQAHRQAHPDSSADRLLVVPLAKASLPPQARTMVWAVMGLAGFVLLIACANLANLQFARTASRAREFAIRSALGAPRRRLLRQLLSEAMLIAAIGGVLGVVLAFWCNQLLQQQFVVEGEQLLKLFIDWRVLGFAFLASSISALAFGLVPAWLASRTDVNLALKQGSRGSTTDRSQHRLQHLLIIGETALALVLLAGAGLLVKGLREFAAIDCGWKVDGLALGYLTLPEAKYGNGNQLRAFAQRLEEKMESTPGVKSAALCWNLPVRQFNVTSSFFIEGRPEQPPGKVESMSVNGITPSYLGTLGMRLIEGRAFTAADDTNRPPVVLINERMARAFWSDGSALGARVNGAEVVGVVSDVKFPGNPGEMRTAYQTYRPFAQEPRGYLNLAMRGDVAPEVIRRMVAEIDPDLPVGQPGPALADVGSTLDRWAVGGRVLTLFALLGLGLAMLGIYGVISGFVARRTGEIGVRMALGALPASVVWLVVRKGLKLSLTGAAAGTLGAIGLERLLASVLPGLPSANAWLLLFISAFLLAVTLIACLFPAMHAARIDPVVALRTD